MNASSYIEWLPAIALCTLNLACAALLHRVVVRDRALVRRRRFFESLSAIAFLVALLLAVSGLLLWQGHPTFVILCSVIWAAFCAAVFALSRSGRRADRDDARLQLPEMWADAAAPAHADEPVPETRRLLPAPFSARPAASLPAPRAPVAGGTAHARATPTRTTRPVAGRSGAPRARATPPVRLSAVPSATSPVAPPGTIAERSASRPGRPSRSRSRSRSRPRLGTGAGRRLRGNLEVYRAGAGNRARTSRNAASRAAQPPTGSDD